MNRITLLGIIIFICNSSFAAPADTTQRNPSVLIIPYKPSMHLSDADPDLASGSDMNMDEMRNAFRQGLIKSLNKNFAEVYDVKGTNNDFVQNSSDVNVLYHTFSYESDVTYPSKNPSKFAIKDTAQRKGKTPARETSYINVGIYDQMLIPDLSEKFNAEYFIIINELDVVTHTEDCLNRALQIYRRDLKVHYSIFDRHGKQIYGDVAVSHFASNSNDVNEIIAKNIPSISQYMIASFKKATN